MNLEDLGLKLKTENDINLPTATVIKFGVMAGLIFAMYFLILTIYKK